MSSTEYLQEFCAELELMMDGHGTRHAISTTRAGQLEIRLGAGDWYWAAQVALDDDPVKAAQAAAEAERYFPPVSDRRTCRVAPRDGLNGYPSRCSTLQRAPQGLGGRAAITAAANQEKKSMNERLNVRLGNPVVMFFWSFAMLLTGVVTGEHGHPRASTRWPPVPS
jgi:hypothetical protein